MHLLSCVWGVVQMASFLQQAEVEKELHAWFKCIATCIMVGGATRDAQLAKSSFSLPRQLTEAQLCDVVSAMRGLEAEWKTVRKLPTCVHLPRLLNKT